MSDALQAKRDELRLLRKREELKQLRAAPQTDPPVKEKPFLDDEFREAADAIQSGITTGAEMLGTASNFVDSYTGAPVRAGIGALQKDENPFAAYADQFGEDATKAPSGRDLMATAGVSEEEFDTPLIADPFTRERIKTSPAAIAGGAAEFATDPTTYVGLGAINRGGKLLTKGVQELAPGAAEAVANFAKERAVKAATGESIGALKKFAKVKGSAGIDAQKALDNVRRSGEILLEPDVAAGFDKPTIGFFSRAKDVGEEAARRKSVYGERIGAIDDLAHQINKEGISPHDLAADVERYANELPGIGDGAAVRKRVAEEPDNLRNYGAALNQPGPAAPVSPSEVRLKIKSQYAFDPQKQDLITSNKDASNRINQIMENRIEGYLEKAKLGRVTETSTKPQLKPSEVGLDLHKGKPSVDLDDNYTLVQRTSTPIKWSKSPASQKDVWDVVDRRTNRPVGSFHADIDKETGPFVRQSNIDNEHAGKGLGTKAYETLSRHYGKLGSDYNTTSDAARAVYKKLGAKQLPDLDGRGLPRQSLEPELTKRELSAPTEEEMSLLNSYEPTKEKFSVMKNAADAGGDQGLRTITRRFVSPSSHGIGAATGIAGAEQMDSLAKGGVVGLASALVNQQVLQRGAAFSARSANAIAKTLQRAPGQFQKWSPVIEKAAKTGYGALLATHHQLMQSDPDYRRRFKDQWVAEEP